MKKAKDRTQGSSVFMRQVKEEECGKELWRGKGYREKRETGRETCGGGQRGGPSGSRAVRIVKVSTVK